MSEAPQAGRRARTPWSDRWLLDAFRERGHPAVEHLQPAPSAWQAFEAAGVPAEELIRVACDLSRCARADLSHVGEREAELLPRTIAERYGITPVGLKDGVLEIATANPLAQHLERDLAFACTRRIRLAVASPLEIAAARTRIYGANGTQLDGPRLQWAVRDAGGAPSAAPSRGAAVDALNAIITDAFDQRASDIHLEPVDGELLVRFRVDGVLHDVCRVPSDVAPLLMNRLKVAAGLDIADRMRPQDGRASTVFDGRTIDLRVSTLPLGSRFEKGVIRVLDGGATSAELGSLGFTAGETHRLHQLLGQTEGMVLVTGPTGSGKTTTLYSALRHVHSRELNIVTVEDPVEYRLEGINQVQVSERSGLSFAAALRSILRQDPDVVLVGEIRDGETAGIAVKASMTGHLVLSTLHTNDAPSTIGRLIDIGVDTGALSGALKGIVAQRLLRRLCPECSAPVALSDLPMDHQILLSGMKTDQLRGAVGCPACRNTGYRGRMVVAEVMVVTPEMQQAIAHGAPADEIAAIAKRSGMHTLWEAGLERVLAGATSLHELLDNVAAPIQDVAPTQSEVDALLEQILGSKKSDASTDAPATPAVSAPASAAATPAIVPASAAAGAAAARKRARTEPPRADALRVLTVDDDRERRRMLRDALEAVGAIVLEAADGEAALAYAKRLTPDLVITEVALPRLDGLALVQALRTDVESATVIVYTDQTDEALLAWARELGAGEAVCSRGEDAATFAVRALSLVPRRFTPRLVAGA
ncbi:MAG TPA: type II/IV secretion system protein [Gemmatimonadaceae bacterium]|nr:type II/IV secretion system protein [Gemmatimonadaceae bacterium]